MWEYTIFAWIHHTCMCLWVSLGANYTSSRCNLHYATYSVKGKVTTLAEASHESSSFVASKEYYSLHKKIPAKNERKKREEEERNGEKMNLNLQITLEKEMIEKEKNIAWWESNVKKKKKKIEDGIE